MAHLKGEKDFICQYRWEPVGIEKGLRKTTISKMIMFQGEQSFRVGLKNRVANPTLFLVTTNLNKRGLKAEAVTYMSVGSQVKKMIFKPIITKQEESRCLQLFTAPLDAIKIGNPIFIFQIYLASSVQDYRVKEMDLLLKNQLLSSLTNGADFEIIAEGKKFPVHKFMLAARSSVFSAKFRDENLGDTVDLSSLDAACIQQFIQFIYTGEMEKPVKSQDLRQLAITYDIKTLQDICDDASHDIDRYQLASLSLELDPALNSSQAPLVDIKPDAASESHDSSSLFVFDCTWNLSEDEVEKAASGISTSIGFVYQQETLFHAQLRKNDVGSQLDAKLYGVFLSYHHEMMSCKVDEVTFFESADDDAPLKMTEASTMDQKKFQAFGVSFNCIPSTPRSLTFRVKMSSSVPNFGLTFADSSWTNQLWAAAMDNLFTDVKFLITGETISAHRSLLSARSPVFAAMFSSGMMEASMGEVRIDDVDPASFRHFLQFLYTGSLVQTADKAKVFVVADKYQVETLMDLCRPSAQPFDHEKLFEIFVSSG